MNLLRLDQLNDGGVVFLTIALSFHFEKQVSRGATKRRRCLRRIRRDLRELKVFEHQARGKAGLVRSVRRGARNRTGHRTMRRQSVTLARGCGQNIEERLVRESKLLPQGKRFTRPHH